jgi:hypothetical protein
MPISPIVVPRVVAIDLLMPVTLVTVWWVLWKSRVDGPLGPWLAVPLVLALGWGALWSFVPAFAALRLAPPPSGQAGAILALLASLVGLLFLPTTRLFFTNARLEVLVWVGPWRMVYGALLMTIGLGGGLPGAFFWSAAIGDIAVGIWACVILARGGRPSTPHLVAWNLLGMADLSHVLVLSAIHLRPYFLANPEVPALNLLPLAGVPVFLALHVLTLWAVWTRHRATTAPAPAP